ncbi:MAG: hypothetical protein FWG98_12000 [Candidatus Cloacimonetes bacterium]|nr:hypothetical protein [Candidatus Cloacimonadota bacterium]
MTWRLLRGRFIEGVSQRRDGGSGTEIASGGGSLKGSRNDGMRDSDMEIASGGDSLKRPRYDGMWGVARRLLRGEVH